MKTFTVIAVAVTLALACSSFALAQEMRKPDEAGSSLWDRTYEQNWEMIKGGPSTLAINGWYLMVPPSTNIIGIPIANWQRRAVFDSKAQCQTQRLKLIQHPPGDVVQPQCVSSDDPRLTP